MAAVFRCVRMWLPIAPPPGWIDKQYKVGACNGPSRPTARVSSDSYRVGKAQVRYCGPVNPVITRIPTFVTFILELAFRWCAPERRGRSVGSVQGQCETLQAATRRKELPFSEDKIGFQASVSPFARNHHNMRYEITLPCWKQPTLVMSWQRHEDSWSRHRQCFCATCNVDILYWIICNKSSLCWKMFLPFSEILAVLEANPLRDVLLQLPWYAVALQINARHFASEIVQCSNMCFLSTNRPSSSNTKIKFKDNQKCAPQVWKGIEWIDCYPLKKTFDTITIFIRSCTLVFSHEGDVALQVVAELTTLPWHVLQNSVELWEDDAEEACASHEEENTENLHVKRIVNNLCLHHKHTEYWHHNKYLILQMIWMWKQIRFSKLHSSLLVQTR